MRCPLFYRIYSSTDTLCKDDYIFWFGALLRSQKFANKGIVYTEDMQTYFEFIYGKITSYSFNRFSISLIN